MADIHTHVYDNAFSPGDLDGHNDMLKYKSGHDMYLVGNKGKVIRHNPNSPKPEDGEPIGSFVPNRLTVNYGGGKSTSLVIFYASLH